MVIHLNCTTKTRFRQDKKQTKILTKYTYAKRGAVRRPIGSIQFFKLFKSRAEGFHSGIKGVSLGEVNTRKLQKLNGAVATTRRKEAEVIVHGGLTLGEDALSDGYGGDNTRRVLVHVEAAIEMRDSGPLVRDLGIGHNRLAVVLLVQLKISLAKHVLREGLALLCKVVGQELKLGELGLTEKGALEGIHVVGKQILLELHVVRGLQQVLDEKDLGKVFSLVHNYSDPDALFMFDMNTPYKFENVYSDNAYILEDEGIFCGWQNFYDEKSGICDFYLSVFSEDEDGVYTRADEHQREKCYSLDTVKRLLAENGFEILGVYSDFDFGQISENTERWYFVARAKK